MGSFFKSYLLLCILHSSNQSNLKLSFILWLLIMEHLRMLWTIIWIHALAVISPWPDFIVAVKNSMTHWRKIGYWTALWFGWWIALHIFYCLMWLALIISQSIVVFTVIKRCWALYLMRLWVQSIISKQEQIVLTQEWIWSIASIVALKQGFLTNALNPKATLFFLGLFTVVISPSTPFWVLLIASGVMIFNTILRFMFVSYISTNWYLKKVLTNSWDRISKVLWVGMFWIWGLVLLKE